MQNLYKNNNIVVSFFEKRDYQKPYIIVRDINNFDEYTAYTRNVRNIKKAWNDIQKLFNDTTSFSDILNILDDTYKLNTHSYCAMD